jgi:hypothetical protein
MQTTGKKNVNISHGMVYDQVGKLNKPNAHQDSKDGLI